MDVELRSKKSQQSHDPVTVCLNVIFRKASDSFGSLNIFKATPPSKHMNTYNRDQTKVPREEVLNYLMSQRT